MLNFNDPVAMEDGTIKNLSAMSGGGGGGSTYSTDPVKIGTWFDGRDIKRVCFTTTSAITNAGTLITTITDFGELLNVGMGARGSNGQTWYSGSTDNANLVGITVNVNGEIKAMSQSTWATPKLNGYIDYIVKGE